MSVGYALLGIKQINALMGAFCKQHKD